MDIDWYAFRLPRHVRATTITISLFHFSLLSTTPLLLLLLLLPFVLAQVVGCYYRWRSMQCKYAAITSALGVGQTTGSSSAAEKRKADWRAALMNRPRRPPLIEDR